MELVLSAAKVAAHAHRDQRRKDEAKTPYINHPIGVAQCLAEAGVTDATILAAALLHDTIEDCGVSYTELRTEFGTDVANLVRECTDDKSLPVVERKKLQIEHAKNMSPGAALIKLADKYDNCRDLLINAPKTWSSERIQGYFVWTMQVVNAIPLQN